MTKITTGEKLPGYLARLKFDPRKWYGLDIKEGKVGEGTDPQNRIFHKLLNEAWVSGVFSDESIISMKLRIKLEHGKAGKKIEIGGEPYMIIQSWSDFTKDQRSYCINGLISEMMELGAVGPTIDSIIREWVIIRE
jgi:hypothetical protein